MNVLQIEQNLYRNIVLPTGGLEYLSAFLQARGIDLLNEVITLSEAGLALDEAQQQFRENAELLSQALHALPNLEMESYAAHLVNDHFIQVIEINDTYTQEGFFDTHASLHDAYDALQTSNSTLSKVIFKVEGKTGRLVNFLYQDNKAKMLWPMKSQFKVLNKDYNAERDTHFVHIRELSQEERTHLAQTPTVMVFDGAQDQRNVRSCQ